MFEPSLRIRQFHSKDLDVLHAIDFLCFPADIAYSRRDFLCCLSQTGSLTRIAEMPGGIVGFILVRIENIRYGHIITLDVVPAARRRGIALALMEDLHRILKQRNITAAVLEVGTNNLAAKCLYERLHYRYIETLPGYYNGREDAYRMMRLI